MSQRIRTLRFWLTTLRSFGFNPFAAMVYFKDESDHRLRWLQATERELGYSVEPPE